MWRETDDGIYSKDSVGPVTPGKGDTSIYPVRCNDLCVKGKESVCGK